MKIVLNRDDLNSIPMTELWSYPYVNQAGLEGHGNFCGQVGYQHYRLLAHLSTLYNDKIIADVGTSSGGSALALAANKNNKVYSLDRVNCRGDAPSEIGNVKFVVDDFHKSEIMDEIVKADLIFLDIQHEGPDEIYFYEELIRRNWRGILIVDDIHLNDAMKNFWNEIKHPKCDITHYGHGDNGSGTGIVSFVEELILDLN